MRPGTAKATLGKGGLVGIPLVHVPGKQACLMLEPIIKSSSAAEPHDGNRTYSSVAPNGLVGKPPWTMISAFMQPSLVSRGGRAA